MRVLVCGGRDFTNYKQLCRVMDALHQDEPITVVVQGEAKGADSLAKKWAASRGITVSPFHANWRKYGKGAGPHRNKRMIKEGRPAYVVAFPGGKGTANMIKQAIENNLKVIEVEIDE